MGRKQYIDHDNQLHMRTETEAEYDTGNIKWRRDITCST